MKLKPNKIKVNQVTLTNTKKKKQYKNKTTKLKFSIEYE